MPAGTYRVGIMQYEDVIELHRKLCRLSDMVLRKMRDACVERAGDNVSVWRQSVQVIEDTWGQTHYDAVCKLSRETYPSLKEELNIAFMYMIRERFARELQKKTHRFKFMPLDLKPFMQRFFPALASSEFVKSGEYFMQTRWRNAAVDEAMRTALHSSCTDLVQKFEIAQKQTETKGVDVVEDSDCQSVAMKTVHMSPDAAHHIGVASMDNKRYAQNRHAEATRDNTTFLERYDDLSKASANDSLLDETVSVKADRMLREQLAHEANIVRRLKSEQKRENMHKAAQAAEAAATISQLKAPAASGIGEGEAAVEGGRALESLDIPHVFTIAPHPTDVQRQKLHRDKNTRPGSNNFETQSEGVTMQQQSSGRLKTDMSTIKVPCTLDMLHSVNVSDDVTSVVMMDNSHTTAPSPHGSPFESFMNEKQSQEPATRGSRTRLAMSEAILRADTPASFKLPVIVAKPASAAPTGSMQTFPYNSNNVKSNSILQAESLLQQKDANESRSTKQSKPVTKSKIVKIRGKVKSTNGTDAAKEVFASAPAARRQEEESKDTNRAGNTMEFLSTPSYLHAHHMTSRLAATPHTAITADRIAKSTVTHTSVFDPRPYDKYLSSGHRPAPTLFDAYNGMDDIEDEYDEEESVF